MNVRKHPNSFRGILINPRTRKIAEVAVEMQDDSYLQSIPDVLGCEAIDYLLLLPGEAAFFEDEVPVDEPNFSFKTPQGAGWFPGKCLILGKDPKTGEATDTDLSVKDVKKWLHGQGASSTQGVNPQCEARDRQPRTAKRLYSVTISWNITI